MQSHSWRAFVPLLFVGGGAVAENEIECGEEGWAHGVKTMSNDDDSDRNERRIASAIHDNESLRRRRSNNFDVWKIGINLSAF